MCGGRVTFVVSFKVSESSGTTERLLSLEDLSIAAAADQPNHGLQEKEFEYEEKFRVDRTKLENLISKGKP